MFTDTTKLSGAAVTPDTEDHSITCMYAPTDRTDARTDGRAAYPGAECGSSYRGLTDQALAHTHTHTRTQIVRQADPGCHSARGTL